jgi:hypothetical protein
LFREPGGTRPLGRLGYKWEDNVKMDITELGWEGVDFIQESQDRDLWQTLVSTVMNSLVP